MFQNLEHYLNMRTFYDFLIIFRYHEHLRIHEHFMISQTLEISLFFEIGNFLKSRFKEEKTQTELKK